MASPEDLRQLELVLTAGCNLRCSYCYQNAKNSRKMSWETLRAAVDLLLKSRRREVLMSFYGGEPLLQFPLIRRAVAYAEEVRRRNLRVKYLVVTNGTLLDEDAAGFLAEHRFETHLSFDGIPAVQALRGRGTFAVLDRLLDRLHGDQRELFRRNLCINVTFMTATLPHLAESFGYFLRKGVREISMGPLVTHDPEWRMESIEALDRQMARILRASLRHYRRTGEVPLKLFRGSGRSASSASRPSPGGPICAAPGGTTLSVDVDGEASGCVMFTKSFQVFPTELLRSRLASMEMGAIQEPEFPKRLAMYPEAAQAARLFHGKEDKFSSYSRCRDCEYFSSCSICPVSIGHIPGNSDPDRVPDSMCAWNLVSLKYRDRFQAKMTEPRRSRSRLPLPASIRRFAAFGGPGGLPREGRLHVGRVDNMSRRRPVGGGGRGEPGESPERV